MSQELIYQMAFGSMEYFYEQLTHGDDNPLDFFSLSNEVLIQFQMTVQHPEVSGDVKVQWFANLSAAYEKIIEERTEEEEIKQEWLERQASRTMGYVTSWEFGK